MYKIIIKNKRYKNINLAKIEKLGQNLFIAEKNNNDKDATKIKS